MTSFALAWRTAQRYRARTLLAIAGVAVVGALLFDMLLLSRGLLLSFADLLGSEGFDVRVIAGEGLPTLRTPIPNSAELADRIRALPQVRDVALIRLERARVHAAPAEATEIAETTERAQTAIRSRMVTLVGRTQSGIGPWTLVRGTNLPYDDANQTDACPVVVGRSLRAALQLEPGSTLDVAAMPVGLASALPPVTCRVVGVVDFGFASIGEDTMATTMRAFQRVVAEATPGEADLIFIASREDVGGAATARAIAELRPDLRVYSNEDVVAEFNRNGFAYFRQISFVLSSLTMAFAFLLVATLLTVSINQRLGEVAALRAIGIGQRRIAAALVWESALLVGTGAVLALPLGGALALTLDRILRQMPGLPERLHFFVFQPRALAIHAALFIVTAIAAAAYPVWLTARLPIAATLRREVVG
jgi:putative ABC transport system permease protein